MAKGMILRRGGAAGGLPNFTYSGTYLLIDDGNKNWRIKFLTSGTLTFMDIKQSVIQLFLVGGGAGGSYSAWPAHTGGGGGAGYTKTVGGLSVSKSVSYEIVVGAGGAKATSGGTTSAFGHSANGGTVSDATSVNGGNGGSGGGSGDTSSGRPGGTNGGNGTGYDSYTGGTGQGTTTREFSEAAGTLYATGGHGGPWSENAMPNTGNGGDGSQPNSSSAASGGSGIVIIRNQRAV